ncbi:MAG: MFS transporter [Cyclobacteriaceae bacterium]|nr:MFS transporter [Cyclobacteriaceae bacterium]
MKGKRNNYLLFVTILLYVSFGLLTSVIGVIIDKFQLDYDVPLSVAALLPFAFFLAYGLTSIPFGIVMDKHGAKIVLLAGTIVMAIGSFLLYISNNYMIVILMVFFVGVGVTAIQIAGNPFIRELDEPKKYTTNLTIIIGIGSLGYAFSPMLVPLVQNGGYSWNTVYLIFAVVNTIILVLLVFAKFPDVKLNQNEKINSSQITTLIKSPIIITYGLGIFFYVGAEVGVSSYILTYMQQIHGVENTQSFWEKGSLLYSAFPSKTALVIGFFWLFQAFGRLIISPMMKHVGEKKIFMIHSLGTIVALIVAITGNVNTALIAFALVGYFTCASFTAIFSATINSFKENHGTISGILGTAIVGGALIGWVVGAVGETLGLKWGMLINVLAFSYVFALAVWGKGKLECVDG